MLRTRLHLIALASLACLGVDLSAAQVLPSGLQVARGQANVSVNGNAMTVRNSNQAILNWQDFSIGKGASVYFEQANSQSAVLNRVVGQNPSQLFGRLASNGQVWLLNPNGVLFGADARVDVAGLVTSTLRLNDSDWLAGRWRFSSEPGDRGSLVNQGELRSSTGGRLVLIGSAVRNEGSLDAPGGQVMLAAGQTVELVDTATPNLSLRLRSGPGEVLNLGSLHAAGGVVDVQAAVVNQQGLVSASRLEAGPGGTVRLVASEQLNLGAASRTEADGTQGGRLQVDAGAAGELRVDGQLSAQGRDGAGGTAQLLGQHAAVQNQAVVDVSGTRGGGLIQFGGGAQGKDASVRNSEAIFLGSGATLRADATHGGDGGNIVLWSDRATRAYGRFSARGAGPGAQGGFVETSGGWVDTRPAQLDLASPQGQAGRWLIDPYNITISDAVSDTNVTITVGNYSPTGSGSLINALGLAAVMNSGVSVVVDSAGAGAEAGNISVNAATIASSGAGNLTLRADGDISISSSSITAGVSPFNITLQAGRSGSGHITISSSTLSTGGGTISLGGFAGTLSGSGSNNPTVGLTGSTLDAGTGALTISANHTGVAGNIGAIDVMTSTLKGSTVSLNGSGVDALGLSIADSTLQAVTSLSLQGSSTNNVGVGGAGGSTLRVTGGALNISGTGTTGVQLELGDSLTGPRLITTAGAVNISGTGSGGTGVSLSGDNGGEITAAGGAVTVSTSQNLAIANFDVSVTGGGLNVNSASTLTVNSSGLHASGQTQVGANNILLTGTSDLRGAFVLVGGNGLSSAAAGFSNGSSLGSGALQAVGGRWVVWTTDDSVLAAGGLVQDFTRFGVSSPAQWSGDTGNGFAYAMTASATVSGTVQSKVYDGTTKLSASNLIISSAPSGVSGSFAPGATLSFVDKNVGNNKPLVFNLANPFNFIDSNSHPVYGITADTSGLSANITPAPLLVSGLSAQNKVYDASLAATLTGSPKVVPLVGDSASLTGSADGRFVSKNVGNGIAVSVGGLSLTGTDAGNYTLSYPSLSANITPASLGVSGVTALSRPYDATTIAGFSGTASVTPLGNDSVSLVGSPSGNFSSKNVGNNLAVSWGGLSLGGPDAGNYTLSYPALSASITPRPLDLGGLKALDKVYDGTTVVSLNGLATIAPLAGDVVTLNGQLSASFASKNAGSSVDVLVSGLSLGGADAGNYTLSNTPLHATISQRPLPVTGLRSQDKVYDATTQADLSGTAAISALAGDAVTLSGSVSAHFQTATVGDGKALLLSGLALSGADAGNYQLSLPSLTASISPATLRYVANPAQMTNGQPVPLLSGSVTGFVGGETLASATSGSLSFTTPATPGSSAGLYAINGGGLTALNYRFVQDPANATALQVFGLPPAVQNEAGVGQAQAALQPSVQRPILATVPPASAAPPAIGVVDLASSLPTALAAPAGSTSPAASSFQPVTLADLSDGAKVTLLSTRQAVKDQLFAPAVQQLERNPALADLPACQSLQEALAGRCLVTDTLRQTFSLQLAQAPTAVPVPMPLAAPPAPPPPPVAAAGAPVPAPSAPSPALLPNAQPKVSPAVSLAATVLAERRKVQKAALPQIERKIALVIGVDTYADSRIPALANAVRDADAMADLFENTLGYETLLLRNPDRATLVAALNRLALVLRPSDSVTVYYAGHGELVQSTQQGYWQLADADPERAETWLSNADISRLVAALPAAQVALVSDSCYSGSLVAEERIRASQAPIDPVALLTRKTVVVMSSGGNEPVFDAGKDGHSPFAYNLMNQLRQVPDWRPGGQVFERVRFAVARELPQRPQYGASSSAGHVRGGDYLFEQRRLENLK